MHEHADMLEHTYRLLNRREYVEPDPLQFLYAYECPRDREVVALVASSLAYGRVKQILRGVGGVLGPHPARRIARASDADLRRDLAGFKHRFSTGEQVATMLTGAAGAIDEYGSLEACFRAGLADDDETTVPALRAFVACLDRDGRCGHLLPAPARGSACKRLHLMLRWLVRRDDVDPGGWDAVGTDKLVVPLDTHMHRISRELGLTARRAADGRTALEVTAGFKRIAPNDPARYDFALTRSGIRNDVPPLGAIRDDPHGAQAPRETARMTVKGQTRA